MQQQVVTSHGNSSLGKTALADGSRTSHTRHTSDHQIPSSHAQDTHDSDSALQSILKAISQANSATTWAHDQSSANPSPSAPVSVNQPSSVLSDEDRSTLQKHLAQLAVQFAEIAEEEQEDLNPTHESLLWSLSTLNGSREQPTTLAIDPNLSSSSLHGHLAEEEEEEDEDMEMITVP